MEFSQFQVKEPNKYFIVEIAPRYRASALSVLIIGLLLIFSPLSSAILKNVATVIVMIDSFILIFANLNTHINITSDTSGFEISRGVWRLRRTKTYDITEITKFQLIRKQEIITPYWRMTTFRCEIIRTNEEKPQIILDSTLRNCYQLYWHFKNIWEKPYAMTLTNPTCDIVDVPSNYQLKTDRNEIRQDQKLGRLGGFSGTVVQHQRESILVFDDRYRSKALGYLPVFVIVFLVGFFLPRNAITTVKNQREGQVLIIFVGIFIFMKYLQSSRRTYLRVSPDEIEFGWELYGFTKTETISNPDLQWLSVTNKKGGYMMLLLSTGDDLHYYGHMTDKKNIPRLQRYIKSTIESYRI